MVFFTLKLSVLHSYKQCNKRIGIHIGKNNYLIQIQEKIGYNNQFKFGRVKTTRTKYLYLYIY